MEKDDHAERNCPFCNTTVAPYDPARFPLRSRRGTIKEVAHKYCWDASSSFRQACTLQAIGADPRIGL